MEARLRAHTSPLCGSPEFTRIAELLRPQPGTLHDPVRPVQGAARRAWIAHDARLRTEEENDEL